MREVLLLGVGLFLCGCGPGAALRTSGQEDPAALRSHLPELDDDVLELGKASKRSLGRRSSVVNLVDLWNNCTAYSKGFNKGVDVLASLKHKFLYADNVKAGSSSVRRLLNRTMRVVWEATDVPSAHEPGRRTNMADFRQEDLEGLFKFSFVRDPVAKFESGVQEAWRQDPTLANMSADDLLKAQIARGKWWLNEHLQPSSWRLAAYNHEGQMVSFDFIGQVEDMAADWRFVVESMAALEPELKTGLLKIRKLNHREEAPPLSKLTEAGVKMMCESKLYSAEWECFGYEKPSACK